MGSKNKSLRKTRTHRINIPIENLGDFSGLAIDLKTLKVSGYNDGALGDLKGTSNLETFYNRKNGKEKYINSNAKSKGASYLDPCRQLFNSYDQIFVIDTNTRKIDQDEVSIACILHIKPSKQTGLDLVMSAGIVGIFEFWNVNQKQENFAWMKLLEQVELNRAHFDGEIGLVTDSDLGNHESFNSRKLPIFDHYYLPKGIQLVYASSDVGSEFLQNKLIRVCDKISGYIFETNEISIKSEGLTQYNDFCTHFRQWDESVIELTSFLS